MNLEELKAQARKIIGLEPAASFTMEEFACGSGGSPSNKMGLVEVHREDEHRYDTVANGPAYRGSVVIECRDTGAKDANSRTIYETPDGRVFVFVYRSGSPYSFDRGFFDFPAMTAKGKGS